tara:strand:- start:146 stop:472 length:327 start_codon:yes stop_codon:yes gene_type:complete
MSKMNSTTKMASKNTPLKRKFLAEWGYGRSTGYSREITLFDEELKELERSICDAKIAGGSFFSEIESIELKNGMTLYAEKTVGYVQAKQRMEEAEKKRIARRQKMVGY